MRTSPRWIVPIAVIGTIAGGVAISSAQAGSAPSLPARTPQQVLASVAGSQVTALSGTVVTRTALGLPSVSLPGGGHGGGASATDAQGLITRFLSGRNTLRVWADGPTKQRVQLLDPFDELDVVRNGTQIWTYSARSNEVGTSTAPAEGGPGQGRKHQVAPSGAADLTPAQMAERAVVAAGPTTAVTLGRPELVAGRAAYALTLTPKTDSTLVDRVVIAVDADTGVPLQVEVYARSFREPAIETGFTSVDFSRPSAATFTFTPPKGAKVTTLKDGGDGGERGHGTATTRTADPADSSTRPTVTGTGWASIVEFPVQKGGISAPPSARTPGGEQPSTGDATALFDQLTKPVAGGRAFSSRLLSVLITDDGRVLAGSVPVPALVDAAKR